MRALVTGGAGSIGSRLAERLIERGNDVTVLDDLSNGDRENVPDGAVFERRDVRSPRLRPQTGRFDVIFHQAGFTRVPLSFEQPEMAHAVNATGTLKMLGVAERHEAAFILASSAAVYGPSPTPISEEEPRTPTSPYGTSKVAAEAWTRLYATAHGVDAVVLRYFNVYGPGQPGVVTEFARRIEAGDPLVIYGDGGQTRDFIHVEDVVEANLRAARPPEGEMEPSFSHEEIYNIGTGVETSINDLAEMLRDEDTEIEYAPEREGDTRRSVADTSRAEAALGFTARPVADRVERNARLY